MITTLRRSLNTWVGRGFFMLLVAAFAPVGHRRRDPQHRHRLYLGGQGRQPPPSSRPSSRKCSCRRPLAQLQPQTQPQRRAQPGCAPCSLAQQSLERPDTAAPPSTCRCSTCTSCVPRRRAARPRCSDIPAFRGANGAFDRSGVRDGAAQQQPDRGALPRPAARRSPPAASCWKLVRAGIAVAGRARRSCRPLDYRFERRPAADMVEFPFSPPSRPRRRPTRRRSDPLGTTTIPGSIQHARIPPHQGGDPVAADARQGHPDQRRGSGQGL